MVCVGVRVVLGAVSLVQNKMLPLLAGNTTVRLLVGPPLHERVVAHASQKVTKEPDLAITLIHKKNVKTVLHPSALRVDGRLNEAARRALCLRRRPGVIARLTHEERQHPSSSCQDRRP